MTKQAAADVAPVKFKQLEPEWITEDENPSHILGVTFACPHCRKVRIGIPFYVRGSRKLADMPELLRGRRNSEDSVWDVRGDANSFDFLSLAPKIDVAGHWFGAIMNGEAVTDSKK